MEGAVSLIKNADIDKHKYSGYRVGFDRGNFYSVDNGFGRNVIIFGADMSSFVHVDNKKRHFNSWERSNTSIRSAFVNFRKNVFNQFYWK